MTRTLAAITAALLATGAQAQTPPAPAAETKTVEVKKVEPGKYVINNRSQITIAGRAWASIENVGATSGTAGTRLGRQNPRWRVTSNSSFINFRGETEVAYGLKAIAQVEAEFGIEGQDGSPFSGTRNAGVGVSHKQFGTLIAGRWDTPMKQTTIGLDPFGGTGIHGYYNTFGSVMTGAVGAAAGNKWDRRASNSLNYTSPNINGLTFLANGSVGETRLSGAVPVDPFTVSAALHFRQGGLYVGAAYEYRHDCGNPDASGAPACSTSFLGTAGANPQGEDQGFRLGIGYANKPTFTKVGAAYEYQDYKTFGRKADAANGVASAAHRTAYRSGYFATITQGLGTDKLEASLAWGWADEMHGTVVGATTKTGAQYYTGALRWWLAKTVDLTAAVTVVENERNAQYNVGNGFTAVAAGSTVTGYGVNFRFMF